LMPAGQSFTFATAGRNFSTKTGRTILVRYYKHCLTSNAVA
jgi:hypothetical protein